MFVSIKYNKGGFYAGNAYTYESLLPLEVGDRVIAPTANDPFQRGIVVETNIPRPSFPCKSIEAYDMEGGECGGNGN